MKKALIQLVDGSILDIDVDQGYVPGCETCDYGSCYTTDLIIRYNNKSCDVISDESMYEYGMSLSDIMKILLNYQEDIKTLKEIEVAEFIKNKLESEYGYNDLEIK